MTTVLEMLKLENFPASSWGLTSGGGGGGESSLAKSSSSDRDDGVDEGEEMTGEAVEGANKKRVKGRLTQVYKWEGARKKVARIKDARENKSMEARG